MKVLAALIATSLAVVSAQQIGEYTPEEHPALPSQVCTTAGGCKTESTSIVLDANYRWLHQVGNYDPCNNNGKWNATVCPDPTTCSKNCAYEGNKVADYEKNYGVTTSGNEVTLKYSDKFGARLYLLADDNKYKVYKLLNQELAFDVDGSLLECGMNGAVYLVPMEEDGGLSKSPSNKVGAKYGGGYCDAQCPTVAFINGLANFGATQTASGQYGACCAEFDLWEANKAATMFTSHPADVTGVYKCSNDVECGFGDNYYKGVPDKSGCGFNSYKNGNHTYYGAGSSFTVDTTKKVTVITQFITDDHTAKGKLVEIRRVYKQGDKVIANSVMASGYDSITDAYCAASVGTPNYHAQHGGLAKMGEEIGRGMVLALSVWADSSSQHMSWLDQGEAGPCPKDGGDPLVLQKMNISVKFSNIRAGDIGSTFTTPLPVTTKPVTTKPVPTTKPAGVPKWGQCGGKDYHGSTVCAEGTCTKYSDYYSQCV